jgi:hypothetical protein
LLLPHRQLSLLSPNFYKTDKAVLQLLHIMSSNYSSSSDESNHSRSTRRSYLSYSSASTIGSAHASNIVLKLPSGKQLIFALSECKNFVGLHYLIKSNVPLNRAGTALEADDYDLLDSEERIYQKESWAEFVKMGMTVEMRWRDAEGRPQQAAPPTEDPNNATHQREVEVEAAAVEPGSVRREEITIIVDEEPFPIRIEDARTRETLLDHIRDFCQTPLDPADLTKCMFVGPANDGEKPRRYTVKTLIDLAEPGLEVRLVLPQPVPIVPGPELRDPLEAHLNPNGGAPAEQAEVHPDIQQPVQEGQQGHQPQRVNGPPAADLAALRLDQGPEPAQEILRDLHKGARKVHVTWRRSKKGFEFTVKTKTGFISETTEIFSAPRDQWEKCKRKGESGADEVCYMCHVTSKGKRRYFWTRKLVEE